MDDSSDDESTSKKKRGRPKCKSKAKLNNKQTKNTSMSSSTGLSGDSNNFMGLQSNHYFYYPYQQQPYTSLTPSMDSMALWMEVYNATFEALQQDYNKNDGKIDAEAIEKIKKMAMEITNDTFSNSTQYPVNNSNNITTTTSSSSDCYPTSSNDSYYTNDINDNKITNRYMNTSQIQYSDGLSMGGVPVYSTSTSSSSSSSIPPYIHNGSYLVHPQTTDEAKAEVVLSKKQEIKREKKQIGIFVPLEFCFVF